jgi:hypothetical protein
MLYICNGSCIMACDNTKYEMSYLLKCKTFYLKVCTWICEVTFSSRMRRWTILYQTESLGTKPCGVKPRPAVPNSHVTSLLFWDIKQCWVVNSLTMFQDHVSVPSSNTEIQNREQSTTEVNWHNLFFWDFVHLFFKGVQCYRSRLFPFISKEAPNLVGPLHWAILSHWVHRNGNC